jgi:hypothetical protein
VRKDGDHVHRGRSHQWPRLGARLGPERIASPLSEAEHLRSRSDREGFGMNPYERRRHALVRMPDASVWHRGT